MNFLPPKSLMKGNILTITDELVELCNTARFEYMSATYGHIRPLWTPEDMDVADDGLDQMEFMIEFIFKDLAYREDTDYPEWKRILLSRVNICDEWETGGICVGDKRPFGNSNWKGDIINVVQISGILIPDREPEDYAKEFYEDMREMVRNFRPRYRKYRVDTYPFFGCCPTPKDGEVRYNDCLLVPERNFCDKVKNLFK